MDLGVFFWPHRGPRSERPVTASDSTGRAVACGGAHAEGRWVQVEELRRYVLELQWPLCTAGPSITKHRHTGKSKESHLRIQAWPPAVVGYIPPKTLGSNPNWSFWAWPWALAFSPVLIRGQKAPTALTPWQVLATFQDTGGQFGRTWDDGSIGIKANLTGVDSVARCMSICLSI